MRVPAADLRLVAARSSLPRSDRIIGDTPRITTDASRHAHRPRELRLETVPPPRTIDTPPPEALLAEYPPPTRIAAEAFRRLVRRALPGAIERVRLGWRIIGYDVPVGRRSVYFAWIMPEAVHVHLGFRYGVLMRDPDGLLEGRIVRGRWVTARPGEEVDDPRVEALVREAARVATLSPGERHLAGLAAGSGTGAERASG